MNGWNCWCTRWCIGECCCCRLYADFSLERSTAPDAPHTENYRKAVREIVPVFLLFYKTYQLIVEITPAPTTIGIELYMEGYR